MASDIRERAKEILKEVPEPPKQIESDRDRALFARLTGTSHDTMWKNWLGGGIMTACNGFVGWYGAQLGSGKYLGRFDLETYLPTIGKGHAWVKSTQDAQPKFGDICRHTAFHVGVALDFDGDIWSHADAGQGGPIRDKDKKLIGGRDVLKRTRGTKPYDFTKLQGWIDLELYFDSTTVALGPSPEWLVGWWDVTWRRQSYYYYFDRNSKVKWTQIMPRSTSQPPLAASDTGNVEVEIPNSISIRWNASGSVEKFSRVFATTDEQMRGTWNEKEPLIAVKM